jgi:hypothetical protein
MKKVDMSERGVVRRLRQVDELRTLCLALMKTKTKVPIDNKNVQPRLTTSGKAE